MLLQWGMGYCLLILESSKAGAMNFAINSHPAAGLRLDYIEARDAGQTAETSTAQLQGANSNTAVGAGMPDTGCSDLSESRSRLGLHAAPALHFPKDPVSGIRAVAAAQAAFAAASAAAALEEVGDQVATLIGAQYGFAHRQLPEEANTAAVEPVALASELGLALGTGSTGALPRQSGANPPRLAQQGQPSSTQEAYPAAALRLDDRPEGTAGNPADPAAEDAALPPRDSDPINGANGSSSGADGSVAAAGQLHTGDPAGRMRGSPAELAAAEPLFLQGPSASRAARSLQAVKQIAGPVSASRSRSVPGGLLSKSTGCHKSQALVSGPFQTYFADLHRHACDVVGRHALLMRCMALQHAEGRF